MKDLSKARATTVEVGEEAAAQRIDNFLLRHLKGVPKSHVYRVLRSGEVRVNSGRVKPEYRLRAGDRVRVPPVRTAEKSPVSKPQEFPIVHEDAALLVVDKPAGVAVHGGSGLSFGVIESLRAARPEAKLLELVHRLDRDTSGLLMVAKKRSALLELHRMLREGKVGKLYLAVAKGRVQGRTLDQPLHKYVNAKGERRVSVQEGGMPAATHVRVLKQNDQYSFLQIRLLTGRTHQIRVHLAHAGHPLLGDDKYGDFDLNHRLQKQGVRRLFLHASQLELAHPQTKEAITLNAPLPAVMKAFIDQHCA